MANKKKRTFRIEWIIFIVALIVFLTSGFFLFRFWMEYKQGTDMYEEVAQAVVSEAPEEVTEEAEGESEEEVPELLLPQVDLAALREINEDAESWIYFPDSQINYPVIYAGDNEFYLNHLIDGSYNGAGTLFVEKQNGRNFADTNTLIYGHNMKNGSMFGSLKLYRDYEYYKEHPVFYIFTDEGVYEYRIFSVRVVSAVGDAYVLTFESDEAYAEYLEKAFRTSMYDTDVESLTTEDKIVTLSTCTASDENRMIVQAVRGDKVR